MHPRPSPSARPSHPRTAAAAAFAIALAGLLAGCGGTAPERHVYALRAADAPAVPSFDPKGPSLGVARFSADLEARTTDLTWRESGSQEVKHRPNDTWVDYPDRLLDQQVIAAASASGHFSAVARTPPTHALDALLTARVVQFTEAATGKGSEARVALEYKLADAGGSVISAGVLQESDPCASRTAPDVAAATSRACARLVDRLLAECRKASPH